LLLGTFLTTLPFSNSSITNVFHKLETKSYRGWE
jgi:hypothetical protein